MIILAFEAESCFWVGDFRESLHKLSKEMAWGGGGAECTEVRGFEETVLHGVGLLVRVPTPPHFPPPLGVLSIKV